MNNVYLVYDGRIDLPNELRLFVSEKAAKEYKLRMIQAGIPTLECLIVSEKVEKSGKLEVVKTINEEEKPICRPKVKEYKPILTITHKKDTEKETPKTPQPIQDPIEQNREKINDMASRVPLSLRNPLVINMVGRENADLVDWEKLDTQNHEGKSNYRAMDIVNESRWFDGYK